MNIWSQCMNDTSYFILQFMGWKTDTESALSANCCFLCCSIRSGSWPTPCSEGFFLPMSPFHLGSGCSFKRACRITLHSIQCIEWASHLWLGLHGPVSGECVLEYVMVTGNGLLAKYDDCKGAMMTWISKLLSPTVVKPGIVKAEVSSASTWLVPDLASGHWLGRIDSRLI